MYEVTDINLMLKSLLPDNVNVKFTIDIFRLKSVLKTNQVLKFTRRSFFSTFLGFTQYHSGPLNDIEGFVQVIPGTHIDNKLLKITGIDKVRSKYDCVNGSIVNGLREPIVYSFALNKFPDHKIYKEPKIKLFKKLNKHVLSQITFYLEDDDHKPVDFSRETIFFCQLIKI